MSVQDISGAFGEPQAVKGPIFFERKELELILRLYGADGGRQRGPRLRHRYPVRGGGLQHLSKILRSSPVSH